MGKSLFDVRCRVGRPEGGRMKPEGMGVKGEESGEGLPDFLLNFAFRS